MKDRIIGLFLCLGILLLCGGCGFVPKPQVESPLNTPVFTSPLLPTATAHPSCLTLIEPKSNTVCGYIVGLDGVPIADRPIFMAHGLFASDNSVVFAALDQSTAPKGITDKNGLFYITDIPSDLYFLMIDNYPQPVMLHEPANQENDLMVDWRNSGGEIDLGVISTDVLVP